MAKQMIDKTINWDDYVAVRRMNPSTLVAGCKSMLRLKRAIDGGFPEETKAMRLGTGIHALLLEPEEFESRFCVVPSFNLDAENLRAPKRKDEPIEDRRTDSKVTSYYKAKVAEFQSLNQGKSFLDRTQYDQALACIEALNSRKHFRELVHDSNKEVTVYGEIESVPFKGRLDLLHPTCICDLKTTFDVAQFGRTFTSLEYAFKLSIYRELVRQNTVGLREVKVIAQETSGDFDNAMFVVPSDILDHAFNRVLLVVNQYKQAVADDVWPGWDRGEDECEIEIPYWARKQMEEIDWSGVEVGEATEPQESYF
jgi:exodeoxyribonuclease VIII